jgi:hypothetical protein
MNLLDFLQSASNAAAGNVSGPVDLVSTLLNKLGVPVQNPVGGSEWMKQKGLMRDVPQSPSSLAGETMGLLAPIGVAAKAPQIASGLLKAQENAAIPRQMNPQMGAIVYHGSPHKFDKFDSSKIGTGEGNQAYGHGLYLAEEQSVAKGYADNLAMRSSGKSVAELKADIKHIEDTMQGPLRAQALHEARAQLEMAKRGQGKTPNLYKVDLPDEAIAKMLDWDKPLSQQAPEVQAAVQRLGIKGTIPRDTTWGGPAEREMVGREIYAELDRAGKVNNPQSSAALRDAGIPGIRYLDAGSRGAGTGTSNYVVFPGAEDLLKILERNGVAP